MKSRLSGIGEIFDLPRRKRQIQELEELTLQPNFWTDRNRAQSTSQKLAELKKSCEAFETLAAEIKDTADLLEIADAEHDVTMFEQLVAQLDPLVKRLDTLELTTFLSEEYDASDCYVSIKPGAGGTESCDWASMLYRMYCRWLDRNEFKYEVMDLQEEEQGIKSATLLVKGTYAYGYLKGEKGVHRLVRISPFDSNARRHTSFTAVDVTPVLPDDADIEVRDEDIKLDFFRSSGAGGQHVNKTSSAVRITHLPTGIVVACQIERSQHQNREVALNMLKAKLYKLQQESREKELKNLQGDQKNISFGSQIRSYVFCPYTLVKDLRTGEQTSDVHGVMDGDLDRFVNGYLKWHAAGEKPRGIGADGEEEEEI
ncbi:MAG TPA: peptide chain release factor 2 [Candidatus Ozemobacteraceae bacterium]|nr:peptide chain release factor 2 [Candidatus Ozemobacteraceae bacterium]